MDLSPLMLTLLVVLPALVLAGWTWFMLTRIDSDLLALETVQSRDFEI